MFKRIFVGGLYGLWLGFKKKKLLPCLFMIPDEIRIRIALLRFGDILIKIYARTGHRGWRRRLGPRAREKGGVR